MGGLVKPEAQLTPSSLDTIVFIHGPQGSGKERIIKRVLDESPRTVLTIDCAKIYSASSDSAVLEALSHQTGYWPVFPFINSLNNVIDIASVGLIGQKGRFNPKPYEFY